MPARGDGDVEVRGNGLRDRPQELLERHHEERRALNVVVGGGVEADVDAAAGGDAVGVPRDRRPVEDVDLGDVRGAAVLPDALGDVPRVARVRPTRCTSVPSRA